MKDSPAAKAPRHHLFDRSASDPGWSSLGRRHWEVDDGLNKAFALGNE